MGPVCAHHGRVCKRWWWRAAPGGKPREMRIILALTLLIAAADPAPALTLLTSEKFAVFGGADGALVQVGPDRAFRTLRDPTCPNVSSIRCTEMPWAPRRSMHEVILDRPARSSGSCAEPE